MEPPAKKKKKDRGKFFLEESLTKYQFWRLRDIVKTSYDQTTSERRQEVISLRSHAASET